MQSERRLGVLALLCVAALVLSTQRIFAEDDTGWPKAIETAKGTVILYQPQLDSLEGNDLRGRAAVSVTLREEESEPAFGAVWLTARIATDRDTRMVEIENVRVDRVRFPDAKPENEQKLARLIENEFPKWEIDLSLDRMLTALELAERDREAAEDLETDPPAILFSDVPAILVTIDGEPRLGEVEGSKLMRVTNTPFLIVLEMESGRYYLDGGEIWFTAEDALGPWEETGNVPKEIRQLSPPSPPEEEQADGEDAPPRDPRTPKIVVATEPSELIFHDGKPEYKPLEVTDLLYMSNTESDVLLEIESQQHFIVLSGRWYSSKSLEGPWIYVPSNELPESFARIPPDSEMGHVLVFVAGTEQATEAVLDNEIPQTSAIKRSETKLEVTYDGEPKFEPIEDTEMQYAVNTSYSVVKVGNRYYACHQAVWFVADSPLGPWIVADDIPEEIYTIPPSSPVYNVKYVYVYDSTPEVVYVGYTPGYVGSYTYGGCVVYGTGFWYPAWYGSIYYPRPSTWGFHVRYNPWYGWSFGISYSTGPFTFSFGFGGYGGYGHGWWGPAGYHGYRHGYHHGYRHGYRAGYYAGQRQAHRENLYNRPDNRQRNARPATSDGRQRAGAMPNQPNNVYTDRNGNVYRRNDDGWQKREGNGWANTDIPTDRTRPSDRGAGAGDRAGSASRPSTGAERPSTGVTRPSTGSQGRPSTGATRPSYGGSGASGLNRDYSARQRGSNRTNSYQRSRGSAGARGGGRRR